MPIRLVALISMLLFYFLRMKRKTERFITFSDLGQIMPSACKHIGFQTEPIFDITHTMRRARQSKKYWKKKKSSYSDPKESFYTSYVDRLDPKISDYKVWKHFTYWFTKLTCGPPPSNWIRIICKLNSTPDYAFGHPQIIKQKIFFVQNNPYLKCILSSRVHVRVLKTR